MAMTQPTQWSCRGCGATLSGRGGKRYCGPDCRPRCLVEDCEKPAHTRYLCSAHATRETRHGDALAPLVRQPNIGNCSVECCDQPMRKRGWCASHYGQWKRTGETQPFTYKWANEPICLVCGVPNGGFRSRKFCSAKCMRYWHNNGKRVPPNPNCARCGIEIDLALGGKTGQRKRRTTKLCRRCKTQSRTEATPGELALRDGPYCQLCGCDVDLLAVFPDKMRPSVDHIIPRAWGGSDAASNNQLTHLLCNQIKSDRYEEVSSRTSP